MYVASSILVNLCQIYPNYALGAKNGPTLNFTFYLDLYKGRLRFYILLILSTKLMKFFSCKDVRS